MPVAALCLVVACIWRFPMLDQVGRSVNVRVSIEVLFQFAVLMAFLAVLWNKNRWVSMFVALACISSVYPIATRHSATAFRHVLAGAFWYFFLVHYLEVSTVPRLLDALCIIAIFHLLFAILQLLNVDPLFTARSGGSDPIVGLMTNPNELSSVFALCFPAFFRPRWIWALPVIIVGLVLAKSSGGTLAAGLALFYWLCMEDLLILAIALAVVGGATWIVAVDTPGFKRVDAWIVALKAYPEHWLLGGGLGHWKVWAHRKDVIDAMGAGVWWKAAHNEFVQGLFEMGIGFIVIIGGYLASIAKRIKLELHPVPVMGLVVVVVTSLVSFPFHIGTTALLAVTWLAILEIELRGTDGKTNEALHGLRGRTPA